MPLIHPTAIISSEAKLAADVRIGAYAVIDGPVTLGAGCSVEPHAHLIGPLTAGDNNAFSSSCVIGGAPQHTAYKGEPTAVEIGSGNTFREHTTVHRAMPLGVGPGSGVTRIGDANLFMAGSHVAHDCLVGNNCIFANCALLGGHVETGDRVFLSGNSAVHQFCRVGRLAFLSGSSASSKDIPPFWVMQDVGYFGELGSVGSYGWGSAYFPQYLVDPKDRIVALMMTQLMPSGGNDLNLKFKVMMYQALVK